MNRQRTYKRTPKALEYLHKYDMESAYVAQRGNLETPKAYKKRLYTVKVTSLRAAAGQPEMRVVKMWPAERRLGEGYGRIC
jgi:hypothetical protein